MGVQGAQRGWRLEVVGVRDMERLPVKGMGPWGSERSVDTPKRGGHSGSGSEAEGTSGMMTRSPDMPCGKGRDSMALLGGVGAGGGREVNRGEGGRSEIGC